MLRDHVGSPRVYPFTLRSMDAAFLHMYAYRVPNIVVLYITPFTF